MGLVTKNVDWMLLGIEVVRERRSDQPTGEFQKASLRSCLLEDCYLGSHLDLDLFRTLRKEDTLLDGMRELIVRMLLLLAGSRSLLLRKIQLYECLVPKYLFIFVMSDFNFLSTNLYFWWFVK